MGYPDPQHEKWQRASLAALASDHARAIALRVNSPPAEISANPLGRNRIEALSRKTANFGETLPRIQRAFPALGLLCLGFGHCGSHNLRQKPKTHRQRLLAVGYNCR